MGKTSNYIAITFLCLATLGLRAQEHIADTATAGSLFRLSDHWSDRDSAKAVSYALKAMDYTGNDPFYKGLAHFYLAGAYFSYDVARSQQEYQKADSLLSGMDTKPAYHFRSRAWHNIGVLEQIKDHDKDFVTLLLHKAIPLSVKGGDSIQTARNYMDLGLVFMNYKDYEKALKYYDIAGQTLQQTARKDPHVLADCNINIAKAYLLWNKPNAAQKPLQTAYRLLSTAPDSAYLPAYYCVEGMYYNNRRQPDKALASLDKGIGISQQLKRPYDTFNLLFEKQDVLKGLRQYREARDILLSIYGEDGKSLLSLDKQLIVSELANTEAALGNYQAAYQWTKQSSRLSDSIYKAKTQMDIASLEQKYQSARKEKELLQLKNRLQFQTLLFWTGIGALAIFLYIFISRSRQKRKFADQQLHALQQDRQIEITSALLEGEERERRRVARDLHDGLGGMLAAVKLKLSSVVHAEPAKQPHPGLEETLEKLDHSIMELRHIARNMMPEMLLRSGLVPALQTLCKWVGSDRMRVECELIDLQDTIPMPIQVDIYRIIQELLTNAGKHAAASEVFVQCSQTGSRFYITVEDNGKGMPEQLPSGKEGMGLQNIRTRVAYLGGKMDIHSVPGKGTILNIEINVSTNA